MILFLDFDGVLHPNDRIEEFCRNASLWTILHALPAARVVFSTSWRDSYDFDNLLDYVTFGGGEDLANRFIGNTPNLEDEGHYGRRDLEIQRWLKDNKHAGKWLAIDDMPELFPKGCPNLHLTDGDIGLTDKDVLEIIRRMS
jgi:hypothetical protein